MNDKQFPEYTGELANPVPDQFFEIPSPDACRLNIVPCIPAWPGPVVANVTIDLVAIEKERNKRMQHFPRRTVRQAALRRVGDGIGAMHKNVVPGLVTIRLGTVV